MSEVTDVVDYNRPGRRLSVREEKFVEAYLANGRNGVKAVIAAGYSPKSASVAASQLIRRPKIRDLINKMSAEASAMTGLSIDKVLREVDKLISSNARRILSPEGDGNGLKPLREWDDDMLASVASIDIDEDMGPDGTVMRRRTKVRFWDKVQALDKAMRHLGLFERDNAQVRENLQIEVLLVGAPGAPPMPLPAPTEGDD